MLRLRALLLFAVLAAALGTAASASAAGTVGTTFPAGFAVPTDASLGTPVLGFGAAGPVHRTPVIVLHGNNDTPYATACNAYGDVHALAQYLVDNGYSPSEVWGLGYQGDQCDLLVDPTHRSGAAHTTVANIPDLDAFVRSVLAYTHAKQVDIVGHSLGGTLARAWMKADHTRNLVRRLVQIDAPNHGIIDCSPDPANYWQLPANGGFTPSSPVCQEYGSPRTPFLRWLNGHGHDHGHGKEAHGKPDVLVIRNADKSFVYFPLLDGFLPGVPAVDSYGVPTDFSHSAELRGATTVNLTNQGVHDPFLGTSHLGILNSPDAWAATLAFLNAKKVK